MIRGARLARACHGSMSPTGTDTILATIPRRRALIINTHILAHRAIDNAGCLVALNGAAAPVPNAFPFSYKPNTLDCDCIVIPAGWTV
ncbi:hypothetical protein BGY98DRAFT_997499 [Russula aff. rugulosa BPL654]|nr:hypothetical protein BGY98DRAFT_997499 [Russula aff. rugulosa BPL654]